MRQFIVWNVLCLAIITSSKAQSVVSSVGRTFTSSNGTLESTLGEVAIKTYQQSPGFLTQGFHQTYSNQDFGPNVEVYPNPTSGFLFIFFPIKGQYEVEVFDLPGKKITDVVYSTNQKNTMHQIDFGNCRSAMYLLFIKNIESGTINTFKIIKD